MPVRLPRLPLPALGLYFLIVGILGGLGLVIDLVDDPGAILRTDALLLVVALLLSGWSGVRLLGHHVDGVWWGLGPQVFQLIELAGGGHFYRLVLGFYWTLPLTGLTPHPSTGFSVMAVLTATPPEARWVALDLVPIFVLATMLVGWRQARRDHPSAAGP